MIGVSNSAPRLPLLVIVNVPPASLSALILPARTLSAKDEMLAVRTELVRLSAARMTGTVRPFSLAHLCRESAGKLILMDPMQSRRDRAEWIGADAVVSPEDAATAIEELSAGRGNDLWSEASGSPAALQSAIDNTGQQGTITVLSFYGNKPVTLQLALKSHFGRQWIVSSQISSIGSGLQPRWDWVRRYGVAQSRLSTLDVEKLVTHRVPFSSAPNAYRLIDEYADETPAVLLDYSDTTPS